MNNFALKMPYGTWMIDYACADDPYESFGIWYEEYKKHPQYWDLVEELGEEPDCLTLIENGAYSFTVANEKLFEIALSLNRLGWRLCDPLRRLAGRIPPW